MGLLSKAGRFAWKHKGKVVKGIELHPGAAMLLKLQHFSEEDKSATAADILASLIEDDEKLASSTAQATLHVLTPTIDRLREVAGLNRQQMQSILRRLSEIQGDQPD